MQGAGKVNRTKLWGLQCGAKVRGDV